MDQILTLQNVASTDFNATVEVTLQAITKASHSVAVSLNDSPIGTVSFEGFAPGTLNTSVPQSLLREGANVFKLTAQNGETDFSFIDQIRVTYAHSFKADNNSLRFTGAGSQQATIDGFTNADIRLVDITDPNAVQEVKGSVKSQNGVYSISGTIPGAGQRLMLAFTAAARSDAGVSPRISRRTGGAQTRVPNSS